MSWGFLLSSRLLGRPALMPRGCIFLCFLNKTELYHRAVTLVHLLLQISAVARQNGGNYTLPQHLWCHFLDLTWLKQPRLGPGKAETKHSRSPTWRKFPRWKLDAKKIQLRGSDKKPSMLDTGTAKTNLAESSRG